MKNSLISLCLALFFIALNNKMVMAQTPTCSTVPAQTIATVVTGTISSGGPISVLIDGNTANQNTYLSVNAAGFRVTAFFESPLYVCGLKSFSKMNAANTLTLNLQLNGNFVGSQLVTQTFLSRQTNFSCQMASSMSAYMSGVVDSWSIGELQPCTLSATPTTTPQPTYTPYPTGTPVPTYTPQPTPTPRFVCMDETWNVSITNDITGSMYFSKTVVSTNTARVTGAITLPLVNQGKMFTGTFATQSGFYQVDMHADAGQVMTGVILLAQLMLIGFYVRNKYARGGR